MLISVAIPCYKSSKTIEKVVNEIRSEITKKAGYDYQIILVNDYPFDSTFDVISKLCSEDKKIVGFTVCTKETIQEYIGAAADSLDEETLEEVSFSFYNVLGDIMEKIKENN